MPLAAATTARLLDVITRIQAEFLLRQDARAAFNTALAALLELTGSEYGFIGEAAADPDGTPFLRTHAVTDIAWNAETRAHYAQFQERGLEFRRLDTLFGRVLVTREPLIANDPANHPHRGGLPHGHPPMRAFLGVPLRAGEHLYGVVGLANRPGGYDDAVVRMLEPLLGTLAAMINSRRAEMQLREAKDRAESASKAKSAFVAAMSHEIRTPVSAIRGAIGLLEEAPLDRDGARVLRVARQSADVLITLIDDVLDFAKIEAGRLDVETVDFEIGSVLDSVLHLLAPRARRNGVQITTYVDPALPRRMRGGRDRIRQVLLNLVGNAVKFAPNGRVRVALRPAPGGLHCEVRDDGPGIAPAAQQALFVEFSRVSGARHESEGGTGLGLAISKRLVELMGGRIGVESTPGEGSNFWFDVQCQRVGEPDTLAEHALGLRVLVCGEGFLRGALRDQLVAWGATVAESATTNGALDLLEANEDAPFGLVILDSRGERLALQVAQDVITNRCRALGVPVARVAEGPVITLRDGRSTEIADYLLGYPVSTGDLAACVLQFTGRGTVARDEGTRTRLRRLPVLNRRVRLLLAEDSQSNRMVIAEFLRRRGCEVDVVVNGLEAVAALRTLVYDVVLMDIDMPEMDGVSALREIRAFPTAVAAIPVIAMTAHATAGAAEEYMAAGFNDYVPKPVDVETLVDRIARWAPPDPMETQPLPARRASPAQSVLDEPALERLAADVGRERLPDMVRIFARELVKRGARVAEARRAERYEVLARESHVLKSSAATFGAREVRQHAQAVNEACRAHRNATALQSADALLAAIPITAEQLARRYRFPLDTNDANESGAAA